jgi:hypothetical protein
MDCCVPRHGRTQSGCVLRADYMKRSTLRTLIIAAALCTASMAQDIRVLPPEPNTIVGAAKGAITKNNPSERQALIGKTHQVFPQVATGGGWETVMVIVNMSLNPMSFTQRFYSSDGQPMSVTFRTVPEGKIITTSALEGTLRAGSSFNFALFDSTPTTQTGWANLVYDATAGRLGAYSMFRQRTPSGAQFEALIPVSAYDDTLFFMSFDNIQGFTTAMALVNPASNMSANVTITANALDGSFIGKTVVMLPPSGHSAFVLTDKIPALAGRMGTLLVSSDITRLSAVGLRFSNTGSFASVPIMNWSDMLN